MTQTFGANSKNDIYLGNDGNIVVVSGIEATRQACVNIARAEYGEMVLAIDEGIPNFETVWRDAANVAQFEAYVRAALLSVDGVLEISEFLIDVRDNKLFYTATIKTVYGETSLNG